MLDFKTIEQRIGLIRKRQKEISMENKELEAEKRALRGQLRVVCPRCQKQTGLAGFAFIQEHWYASPYSCAGGGFWNESKPEACSIVCPHCASELRIFNLPEHEDVAAIIKKVFPPLFFKKYQKRYKKRYRK